MAACSTLLGPPKAGDRVEKVIVAFFEYLRQRGLPSLDNYLSIDFECTITKPKLMKEFGYTMVHNRKVIKQGSLVINWVDHPQVNYRWLKSAIQAEYRHLGGTSVTLDDMVSRGKMPENAVHSILQLLRSTTSRGYYLVGQNMMGLDRRLLKQHAETLLGDEYDFPENLVVDMGCLYKASQLPTQVLPRPTESLRDYFGRVAHIYAPGVRWSLPTCLQALNLKFDINRMHGAEYDSFCCSSALEALRDRYCGVGSSE